MRNFAVMSHIAYHKLEFLKSREELWAPVFFEVFDNNVGLSLAYENRLLLEKG